MRSTAPDRTIRIDPERIDAVVFDMDGVLTDTAVIHERAWARTFDGFLERLHPWAPAAAVDPERLRHLLDRTHRLMRRARLGHLLATAGGRALPVSAAG